MIHARKLLAASLLASLAVPAPALERLDDTRMAREEIAAPQAVALTPEVPDSEAVTTETRRVDVPANRQESYQLLLLPRYGITIPLDRTPATGSGAR